MWGLGLCPPEGADGGWCLLPTEGLNWGTRPLDFADYMTITAGFAGGFLLQAKPPVFFDRRFGSLLCKS